MNKFWKDMGIAFTMGFIVPSVLLSAVVSLAKDNDKAAETEPTVVWESEVQMQSEIQQPDVPLLREDGQIVQIPMNEYLTCVVLAEMPVTFEEEALKAQAVVARTYTLRALKGASKHTDAAVCTDASCCQSHIDVASYLEKGGKAEDVQHIRDIVQSTDGQVLTYEGNLIEATYFSCSGGLTEDAVAVWGADVPYLQSVISPGEEHATYYTDTVTFTRSEFETGLGILLEGNPEQWVSDVIYTDGGGVDTITICGVSFSGTQLRKLLSLRSTAFTVVPSDDSVSIHTRGYGHRVGMSQYGADAMATSGYTYQQILAHYYQGTTLTNQLD